MAKLTVKVDLLFSSDQEVPTELDNNVRLLLLQCLLHVQEFVRDGDFTGFTIQPYIDEGKPISFDLNLDFNISNLVQLANK
jgi:hypothetical protein